MPEHEVMSEFWKIETAKIHAAQAAGRISVYAKTLPNYAQVFQAESTLLTCIDERVTEGIRAAGSLILVSLQEAKDFCAKAGVTGLCSHAGCGAAGVLYRREHSLDGHAEVSSETIETYAQEKTRQLAASLGLPYKGHIPLEQMTVPQGGHCARCLYYVNVPNFDPHPQSSLPQGFIIERLYHTAENALGEAELAVSIATGGHGYGSLINESEPFFVYVVARAEDQEKLALELQPLVSHYGNLVRIETFIP